MFDNDWESKEFKSQESKCFSNKGNRDEWISKQEVSDRIVGPFLNSESVKEKDYEPVQRSLSNLREYFKKFQSINKNSVASK